MIFCPIILVSYHAAIQDVTYLHAIGSTQGCYQKPNMPFQRTQNLMDITKV